MATRRSRGDGGLSWDETRQRWVASLTVGYTPAGKRIVKRGSGRTKTEAQRKLREMHPRLRRRPGRLAATGLHRRSVPSATGSSSGLTRPRRGHQSAKCTHPREHARHPGARRAEAARAWLPTM